MIRRPLLPEYERDRLLMKRAIPKTIGLIERGATLAWAGVGDSIIAQQSSEGSSSAPNGQTRDRATATGTANTYFGDAWSADLLASIPLYDFGDGAGQVHTKTSLAWFAIDHLQRTGCTINWLNFGIAGSTSGAGLADPLKTAWTGSAANLVLLHYGMNEPGLATTEGNMRQLLAAAFAAGKEAIVVAPARTNATSGIADSTWEYTCRALRRAAEYVDPLSGRCAGFLDSRLIYRDENLGALGLTRLECCQANLFNHPGLREHQMIGRLLARLILG